MTLDALQSVIAMKHWGEASPQMNRILMRKWWRMPLFMIKKQKLLGEG